MEDLGDKIRQLDAALKDAAAEKRRANENAKCASDKGCQVRFGSATSLLWVDRLLLSSSQQVASCYFTGHTELEEDNAFARRSRSCKSV